MTRKGRLAAIALLLMAMLMLAACSGGRGNPGSTAPNDVAVAAMKAMTQAADTAGQAAGVSSTGNTYTLTGFTADDGVTRVVGGSFEMDGNGNVTTPISRCRSATRHLNSSSSQHLQARDRISR